MDERRVNGGPAERPLRVLVVEDHALLAQTLAAALRQDGLDVLCAEQLDRASVLDAAAAHRPDVALLDLVLDDETTTLSYIGPLRELGASVVVVTGQTDKVQLAECVEAGALGIVGKHEPFEHLVAAVHEVGDLQSLLTPAQRDDLLAELRRQRADTLDRLAPFERLSRREAEVLAALMEGRSAETIAADDFVSIATVRSQIRAVLSKLGVNSQLAAVALARRSGWSR
jgi:DNA-binding NarL/FixJ family response regulator